MSVVKSNNTSAPDDEQRAYVRKPVTLSEEDARQDRADKRAEARAQRKERS